MAVKSVLNKNIYGATLAGGSNYGSVTKVTPTTGGAYASGIELLNPTKAITSTPSLNSAIKPNLNIKPINAAGGYGSSGGVTKEGVIIGGGAINTTFQPSYGSGKVGAVKDGAITGNLGVTKLPTTGTAYSDYLTALQSKNTTTKTEVKTTAPTTTENKTEQPATYEEYLAQQRELLDKRKADADKQAEAAKERAAVDAQASYAQNMATYGTNAESLAQMGLQGGGYSDYINAQAYAQKRADVQQANVTEQAAKAQNTATYEDALSDLNKSEIEYKEKQKEKAAALKQGALDAINQGSLNESNIGSYLDSLKGLGATDRDVADIRETYQKNYYNDFLAAITDGTLSSTKSVDDAYNAGNLSKKHYESLKKAWNDDINTDSNAFDGYESYEAAKKDYQEIMGNSWLSAETKSKLEKAFKGYEAKKYESNVSSGYNAHSSTVTLNTPNGKVTVTYGVNSKSLKPKSGNAVFNSDVYKNAGSGQVFIVNGRPYVKLDNGDLGWVNDYWGQGAYESLKNTFKGTIYDIS